MIVAPDKRDSKVPIEEELMEKLSMYLEIWKDDPLLYVIDCVGDTPTHQQAEILKAIPIYKFVSVKSGHGIGKTRLFGWTANWYLDCHGKIDGLTRVPITGAGGSQLEVTVFPEIEGVCKRKAKFFADQYNCVTGKVSLIGHEKTHFAILRTARVENPDALQGFHECFFQIDEGSGVHDKIFEVARGAMGDPGSYGLMAGNPTKTSGYMFNLFDSEQKTWKTLSFSSMDTLHDEEYTYKYLDAWGDVQTKTVKGRQTLKWVEEMKEEYGENSNVFKIRVLGEFANEGMDLVIEPEWLKELVREETVDNSEEKRIMGLDPARSGSDKFGVFIRKGRVLEYGCEWDSQDTQVCIDKIKVLQEEWNCDEMVIDSIGMGGPIYDTLKRLEFPIFACDVREEALLPNNSTCHTCRDSLWWLSRKFFKNCAPIAGKFLKEKPLKKLLKELCYPTYIIDKWLEIESKKAMKKRGLPSPNLADACNLTFFRDRALRKDNHHKKKKKIKKKRKKMPGFKCV